MIYWLQAFACPALLFGAISFFVSYDLRVLLLVVGSISGIVLAEFIRRKYGLETFFGRVYGPNEMDEKTGKKTSKAGEPIE